MKRKTILIILVLVLQLKLGSQNLAEQGFDHYNTFSGLSHNTITGLAQDARGYMWISTSSGLNRFDGTRFIQFHSNNDSVSPATEELFEMNWIDGHRLAIFTTGLHILNTKTGIATNVFVPYHNRQYQYKFNMVERVLGDKNGDLYLLTRSGFYHYDKDYRLVARFDYYAEADVPVTHFFFGREIFELDPSRLLIVSIDGFRLYDKQKHKLRKLSSTDLPVFKDFMNYPETFFSFFQIAPGNFIAHKLYTDTISYVNTFTNKKIDSRLPFIPDKLEIHWRSKLFPAGNDIYYLTGHTSGFYTLQLDRKTGKIITNPKKSFSSHFCSALLVDKDKSLWIGTNKGLYRQNQGRSKVELALLPPNTDNYPNIKVDDVYASDQNVFAATRGEGGLIVFDKQTLAYKKQVFFNQFPGGSIHLRAIVPVNDSVLLVATNHPLVLYNHVTGKVRELKLPEWHPADWANDLYKDKKGNIWIGTSQIFKYYPPTGALERIPFHERILSVPTVIAEDTSGHIWMAGHGIARYNTKAGMIDMLLDSFPSIKMPDKQINAMAIDSNNVIWFNSNNNGLIAYDINKKTFRQFTKKDGLPDDNIASLLVIENKLWIACYSGLASLDLRSLQIVSFNKSDGLPEMPVQRGARFYYDQKTKKIYLGLTAAVTRFDPLQIPGKKTAPEIFIENLVIDGRTKHFLPSDEIKASWKDNEMRFMIGSINFSDGFTHRYAYRIINEENTPWTVLGTQPSFSISNLSPGSHRIAIKVFSPNNRWPEQVKEITVRIRPPVWQQAWFIVMETILVILVAWLLVRWRITLAKRKERANTEIERLKADDYKNRFELEHISHYFSSSLSGKKTEDEVLWDVAQNLIGKMNYEDCIIYRWNRDKTKMIQKAAFGPKGKPELITEQYFDVAPGEGIVGEVMITHTPILVGDTRTDSRYRVDDAIRLSEICVPILHNGELLGIIDSEHHLPDYFSERDIKILTTIATLIANKLKQLESEKTLAASRIELASINEQLAEARLSALQAQMNPHFVFNALNSIKRMILDADNEKASRYLSKFASMIRMTLNHSREIFITLDENIKYLKAYLEMEQLRFDDSFTWNITVDEEIDTSETTVPSMMIQPLVENAIWHGLMQSTDDKKILISFTQEDNTITCTVEDNGIGIRKSEQLKETHKTTHRSVGLENLRNRIRVLNEKYNMDCTLAITDLNETNPALTGTRVTLQFDLVNV